MWQLAAAAITGFIAKENVVGTLAVVYGVTNLIDTEELALVGSGNEVATIMGLTKVAAHCLSDVQLIYAALLCCSGGNELGDEEREMAVWRYLSSACNRLYSSVPCISDRYAGNDRFSGNRIYSRFDRSSRVCGNHYMEDSPVRQRVCGRIQFACSQISGIMIAVGKEICPPLDIEKGKDDIYDEYYCDHYSGGCYRQRGFVSDQSEKKRCEMCRMPGGRKLLCC